ncbi:unnamed protein product (macronuclear) [Paramecium tetraurelia]|uniref:HTH psq-type domain-containing protein n=1 Tax=Paramecium tetraurelia TaxID=5888 RepID=A0EBR2_PARTE|nr:uncharacterized protein GSPATT00025463001 [Paramecium tetraurelia]CAK92729.1 unnamed protein product [Paramecium tetraurelia]|eukprot:XP_001460126.1 hypothetical protein (macronuclear) [Paramecium tetraurelia strain d4-2]
MPELENFNLDKGIKKKTLHDKFRRKIQFLQLVLCQNQTIKNAAAQCQIKFATAKVVLKKFRNLGFIKNSDKDYEKQIDMLRQIAFIKSEIKQDQMQKREREFQALSQRIKKIQPLQENEATEIQIDINFQIKIFQEELRNQETIQLHLVKSVLLEQIKLMKNNSISVS